MKFYILLLFSIITESVLATPQCSEILLYKNETIQFHYSPLERLRELDRKLDRKLEKLFPALTSACWKGYYGTWKIKNDSLFLLNIIKDESYDAISGLGNGLSLDSLFEKSRITKDGVFANWYTEEIYDNYGNIIDYEEDLFGTAVYTGNFSCSIEHGKVSNIKTIMKPKHEIDSIIQARIMREDTMVCLVVEEWPILITENRTYITSELDSFINNQITDCNTISTTNAIKNFIISPETLEYCSGTVYISFIIEKDGSVSKRRLRLKLFPKNDIEAMRIANLMTEWKPGKVNDRVVRTEMIVPFKFNYE